MKSYVRPLRLRQPLSLARAGVCVVELVRLPSTVLLVARLQL